MVSLAMKRHGAMYMYISILETIFSPTFAPVRYAVSSYKKFLSYMTTWLLSYMGRVIFFSEKRYSKDKYIAPK